MAKDINQTVLQLAQTLIDNEIKDVALNSSFIEDKINLALCLKPEWADLIDKDWVRSELIRRFSEWTGKSLILKNNENHQAWLNDNRKKNWRYWQRYKELLEQKIPLSSVDSTDYVTDEILGELEDPLREGAWDRRGLVVGHVQSGKTSNYTGLICKAADAGYKIIIVLAGLHNNLRAQTQMRLDEGFLGYETSPNIEDIKVIGVGQIDSDPSIRPNYATNRTEKGDFKASIAKNLGIKPEQRPWLFVVKKNKSVLKGLYNWLETHVAEHHESGSGRKIVDQLPLLLIDDEADHASVDTSQEVLNEDGSPNKEHDPTAINSLVRKILHIFSRSAYVGYTATPFANIFIHEKGETDLEGPDLFPSSFIINLAASSSYVGPTQVFGSRFSDEDKQGLPLTRVVDDFVHLDNDKSGWMPIGHKSDHVPKFNREYQIPPSLVTGIYSFILSCAIRNLRGQEKEHSSMLVHVTRFKAVQSHVSEQVKAFLKNVKQKVTRNIDHEEVLQELKLLWESDYRQTHQAMRSDKSLSIIGEELKWGDIEKQIYSVLQDVKVKVINGNAKEALDYSEYKEIGLKVIAIGGDKLSRGLTLEGLCVSYFLRSSKMYDTLMQMGRWFGYRPGYLDLCRLYTTTELIEWFEHISDAAEELRDEFEIMAANGDTPKNYGLKVQSHPVLLVTSRLKMRTSKEMYLSFSGTVLETITFHKDMTKLNHNISEGKRLIEKVGSECDERPLLDFGLKKQKWPGYIWKNVESKHIVEFLKGYKTHSDAYKVKSDLIAEFIESMNALGELTNWTLAVGGGSAPLFSFNKNIEVKMVKRSNKHNHRNSFTIGRLLSSHDEEIDLTESEWKKALIAGQKAWQDDPGRSRSKEKPTDPSGPYIRDVRNKKKGLLILYVIDSYASGMSKKGETSYPILGFGISFPASASGKKVSYKVNNTEWKKWEQEYGFGD